MEHLGLPWCKKGSLLPRIASDRTDLDAGDSASEPFKKLASQGLLNRAR